MNRSLRPALPLVALALINPFPAKASSLPRLVPSMSALSGQTAERAGQRLNRDAVLPWTARNASPVPRTPFRYRLPAAMTKRQGYSLDWAGGALHVVSSRAKSARKEVTTAPYNYGRFAVIETNADVSQSIGRQDSVSLGLAYALERRRPSYFVGLHNLYRTQDAAVSVSWVHDDRFRVSASLFKTAPIGGRSVAERQVELAGGAPFAARGYALTASFSASRNPDPLLVGVDVRSQRYSPLDAGLIGTSSGRRDARIGVFLRRSF
jgi:hypothetical protein